MTVTIFHVGIFHVRTLIHYHRAEKFVAERGGPSNHTALIRDKDEDVRMPFDI